MSFLHGKLITIKNRDMEINGVITQQSLHNRRDKGICVLSAFAYTKTYAMLISMWYVPAHSP